MSSKQETGSEENGQGFSIGQLARNAGVNVETIRFYQRRGLLSKPTRFYGRIRRYHEADAARLNFIRSAKRLGFALDEIAELLRLEDGLHCHEASQLAAHKLRDIHIRLADMRRIEAVLADLLDACQSGQSKRKCPLIAALQNPDRYE